MSQWTRQRGEAMCQSRNEGFDRSPQTDRERSRKVAHTRKERKIDHRFYAHGCGMFMSSRTNDPETVNTGEPRE